jgi:hypothetical protein
VEVKKLLIDLLLHLQALFHSGKWRLNINWRCGNALEPHFECKYTLAQQIYDGSGGNLGSEWNE